MGRGGEGREGEEGGGGTLLCLLAYCWGGMEGAVATKRRREGAGGMLGREEGRDLEVGKERGVTGPPLAHE